MDGASRALVIRFGGDAGRAAALNANAGPGAGLDGAVRRDAARAGVILPHANLGDAFLRGAAVSESARSERSADTDD